MNKIQFNLSQNYFDSTINNCNKNQKCRDMASKYKGELCDAKINFNDPTKPNSDYNNLLDFLVKHFNYIISINEQTKKSFSKKINNDKLQ